MLRVEAWDRVFRFVAQESAALHLVSTTVKNTNQIAMTQNAAKALPTKAALVNWVRRLRKISCSAAIGSLRTLENAQKNAIRELRICK
jgi:hypothetical protein